MAAKTKRKFSLKPDESKLVKAKVTATLSSEKWEYIESWLRNAPDCADEWDIVIDTLEAQEV